MKRTRNKLGLILLLCITMAHAQQRLDDSASPMQQVRADLVELSPFGTSEKSREPQLQARVSRLDIRLDTSAYEGQRVRIYMQVPGPITGLASPDALRLNWRAGGTFRDGSLVPGQRELVFEGRIEKPVLREVLALELLIDARAITGTIRFEPVFEIEAL